MRSQRRELVRDLVAAHDGFAVLARVAGGALGGAPRRVQPADLRLEPGRARAQALVVGHDEGGGRNAGQQGEDPAPRRAAVGGGEVEAHAREAAHAKASTVGLASAK